MTRSPSRAAIPRRLVAALTPLTVAALLVSACGGGDDGGAGGGSGGGTPTGTVTLGYAGGGNLDSYYKTVTQAAQKALPGLTVKLVSYPTYDDQLNQMPQQFAAKTIPDVIVWDNSAPVRQYAEQGAIQPLDSSDAAVKDAVAAMPPALVKAWTIDGKLYGLPSYLQNSAFVSNLALLRSAGM